MAASAWGSDHLHVGPPHFAGKHLPGVVTVEPAHNHLHQLFNLVRIDPNLVNLLQNTIHAYLPRRGIKIQIVP